MAEAFPLVDDGIWCEVKPSAEGGRFAGRPALFLDRDGVVVEEVSYLHRPGDVRPIAGAGETIAAANRHGLAVVLVTNQSGIGRGYYGWADFRATQDAIDAALAADGGRLDMVIACPFTPRGAGAYVHPDHPDRKPNPGMLNRAIAGLGVIAGQSWLVGDRGLDVRAAKAAGLAGALQVASGHGADPDERAEACAQAGPGFTVLTGDSIAAAAGLVSRMAAHEGDSAVGQV